MDASLKKRPHSINYNNIAFYNKYHFSLGLKATHKIKKKGYYYRYLPQNIYKKAATKKNKKKKVREKKHFKLFFIFYYNWKELKVIYPLLGT